MAMSTETFIREYELEDGSGTLHLEQVLEGDVNCVVWDAALVLAKYLEVRSLKTKNFLKGQKVIELGSGLGCVGLVATCLGGNVTLSDQAKALPLLQNNVKKNEELLEQFKGSATVKALDWGDEDETNTFDVILLADCIYYKQSIEPLVSTLLRLSSPETEIILSQEDRSYSDVQKETWNKFISTIKPYFNRTDIQRSDQHNEFQSPDIDLYTLKRITK